MKIDFIKIGKQALAIVKKNRYLWWFGFIIALTSLSGMPFSFNKEDLNNEAKQKATDFISSHAVLVASVLIAFFIIFIILLILGIAARGAVIYSVNLELKGEKSSFRKGMKIGFRFFWKLLSISWLLGLMVLACIFVMSIPIIFLFANKAFFLGGFLAFIALLILIPLFFLFYFLKRYGYLYVVLGKLSAWAALESAYNLLWKKLRESFFTALLFAVLGIIFSAAAFILIIPILILFLIIGLILYLIFKTTGIIIAVILGFSIFFIAILFLKSIFEAFYYTAWVLVFHEIAKPEMKETVKVAEEAETKTAPAADAAKGI
ncbi:MAG: hypothetical protein NTZ97_04530 [Candidatus Moranbacteria bacterium]|nr:hypothetical protein [Candidatus Moranbacteria bacterium]